MVDAVLCFIFYFITVKKNVCVDPNSVLASFFLLLSIFIWRRLLRVPWLARRSNQSILKEINPEYSLEGLMLKLQ